MMDVFVSFGSSIEEFKQLGEALRKKGYKAFMDFSTFRITTDAPYEAIVKLRRKFKGIQSVSILDERRY